MPPHFFFRAKKLDYDTAVRADVDKQNYSTAPRHWYIDAEIGCERCGEVFRFSADEQRAWYETYRFYVDSFPRKCNDCRRTSRHMKDLRQQYEARIAEALRGRDIELKRNLVEVISELQMLGSLLEDRILENRQVLLRQIAKVTG
jgi:hypothetical protein